MIRNLLFLSLFCTFHILQSILLVNGCNEIICGSVVTKCLLTESCKCDLKNCGTCCKNCYLCLNDLFDECCSCVEMCSKPNNIPDSSSKLSHVEDLPDPIPTLFDSLVSEQDLLNRWLTITFPVDLASRLKTEIKKDPDLSIFSDTNEQEIDPVKDIMTVDCSVAYMTDCMPWNKCRATCQSMGAQSYRWFHNGCCECVGDKCINYGISESRCTKCSAFEENQPTDLDLDYGQNDI